MLTNAIGNTMNAIIPRPRSWTAVRSICMSSKENGPGCNAVAKQGYLHCSISTIAHIELAKYSVMISLHRINGAKEDPMFVIAVVFLVSALTLSILGVIEA